MPTIETAIFIAAPLNRVYAIAKDNRSFPEFMKDVKSLTIIEETEHKVVSDWVGIVPTFGIKMRWRQEDEWDDAAHICLFRQVTGDFDSMKGDWKFSEENGGTRFTSHLDYEYSVPTLGPLVKKVIHGIVTKNMENLLEAIKKRAEA